MFQPQPPSGLQVEIHRGDESAVVVTAGGGIRSYTVGGMAVIDGYAADEICSRGKGQVLMPWPNRVRDGRYTVAGVEHQLDISEVARNNAIHGLVRWSTWEVGERLDSRVVLSHELFASHGYPFSLQLEVAYALTGNGLKVTMSAMNVGAGTAPFGAGAHPYVMAGATGIDNVTLRLAGRRRLLCDDRLIPTGDEAVADTGFDYTEGREIGTTVFDTCFADLERDDDGVAHTRLSRDQVEVDVWQDAAMDYVMVFSGGRRSLAVEPMTCAPNAFQSGQGLVWLEPGARHSCVWGISARI